MSDHKIVLASFVLVSRLDRDELPKRFIAWKLDDKILDDKLVEDGIKIICKEIPFLKKKFKYIWYDKSNKKIISFLKQKNKEYVKMKNKNKNDLFEELKKFNQTIFASNEIYINKKNELKQRLESYYNDKKECLEKRLRDDRRKFCK